MDSVVWVAKIVQTNGRRDEGCWISMECCHVLSVWLQKDF